MSKRRIIVSDFYREVSPPDSLSSMSTGTPSGKSDSPKGEESSSLPSGDTARNIGRPGPDSPNLKTKNLDRSESYGRKPAEGFDGGYVHDSGSGSARVIPYDSGFANNSSPLRNAGLIKPPKHLVDKITEILRSAFASYWVNEQRMEDEKYISPLSFEHLSNFEYLSEKFNEVYLSAKKKKATFEELDTALRSLRKVTQELLNIIGSGTLANQDLTIFDLILGRLSSISVFEEPEKYTKELSFIDKKSTSRITSYLKKYVTVFVSYISEESRRLYESEAKKVKKFDKLRDKRIAYTWLLQTEVLGTIRLSLKEGPPKALAYYNYGDNIHNIGMFTNPKSTDLSKTHLKKIKGYVRHELVHAMQKQMATNFNVDQAGIPNKKYDPNYRSYMINTQKEKELKTQYASEGLDPTRIQIHALDDLEFYSRLLDEVVWFKELNVSRSDLNQEVHKWVSGRQFFLSLKRFKRKNWSKAVGIFFEAVNSNRKYARKCDKDFIQRVANRYLKARMLTQFVNWVKGDSDLIEGYIAKLGYHLENITPSYIEANWEYTGQDDLIVGLNLSYFPIINIVSGRKVNLNARARETKIKNNLYSLFEIENIHYDHDLKDLFGEIQSKEVPLIENLGKTIFSEEVLGSFSTCVEAFNKELCKHYVLKVVRPYMTFHITSFHKSYDPHPLPSINLPHGHFKGLRSRRFKELKDGFELHYETEASKSSFLFYVENSTLKTRVKVDGKTIVFDGFLDGVSCLRLAWLGV